MSKTYTCNVAEICENGDAIIEFSEEMVNDLGWQVGDTLDISMENGTVVLKNLTRPFIGE
jgi:formylmethanofuran dehydrogenase subunit D